MLAGKEVHRGDLIGKVWVGHYWNELNDKLVSMALI